MTSQGSPPPKPPLADQLRPARWMVVAGIAAAVVVGGAMLLRGGEGGGTVPAPAGDAAVVDSSGSSRGGGTDSTDGISPDAGPPRSVPEDPREFLEPQLPDTDFGPGVDTVPLPYALGGSVAVPSQAVDAAAAQMRALYGDATDIAGFEVVFVGPERIGLNISRGGGEEGGLLVMVLDPSGSGQWVTGTGHYGSGLDP